MSTSNVAAEGEINDAVIATNQVMTNRDGIKWDTLLSWLQEDKSWELKRKFFRDELSQDEQKALAKMYGKSIGELEEYMSLQQAMDNSRPQPNSTFTPEKNDAPAPSPDVAVAPGHASQQEDQQLPSLFEEIAAREQCHKGCIILFLEGTSKLIVEQLTEEGRPLKLYIEVLKSQYKIFKKLDNKKIFAECIVTTIKEQFPIVKFACVRKNLRSYVKLTLSQVADVTYAILRSGNIQLVGISYTSDQNDNILRDVSNNLHPSSVANDHKVGKSFFDFQGMDLPMLNEVCELLKRNDK